MRYKPRTKTMTRDESDDVSTKKDDAPAMPRLPLAIDDIPDDESPW